MNISRLKSCEKDLMSRLEGDFFEAAMILEAKIDPGCEEVGCAAFLPGVWDVLELFVSQCS